MQSMQQKVIVHILFTILGMLIQVYTVLEKTLMNVSRNTNKAH